MTAVVIGGSSGLGRALCEELAMRGRNVVIVASAQEDCCRLAEDLRLRYGVSALPLAVDARNLTTFRDQLAQFLVDIGPISDLFLPMGAACDDDHIGEAAKTMAEIWSVNYAAVVAAIETVSPRMAAVGGLRSRIVGFGSIAAIRARNRNVQYAAAKSALATYFEGLRHAFVSTATVAQFYVVGYVESGQSFGKTQLFPAMPARKAACRVLNDSDRDFGRRFLPRWWAFVAVVLMFLPWRIYSSLRH